MSTILEGRLKIGEYPTPDDVAWLRDEHGIEAVISLQDQFDLMDKSIDAALLEQAYREAGVEFRRFGVLDGDADDLAAGLGPILVALRSLLAAGRRVYVHCNAGFNRAPTVTIAYLHAYEGLTLDAAHAFVRERRSCAPYLGALRQFFASRPPDDESGVP